MSSSSICPHFTQNAWKKDLCSNCFKSKDEHKQNSLSKANSVLSKYLTTATTTATATTTTSGVTGMKITKISNTNLSQMQKSISEQQHEEHKKTDFPNKNKKPVKSIIKKTLTLRTTTTTTTTGMSKGNNKSLQNKVSFPKNLSEVIGYGGEWSDDDSDSDDHDFMNIEPDDHDEVHGNSTDDEATIEMRRITRANTDFNMNNGNLLGDPQDNIKKSFAALKLGAPQVDKEGKKQTLKINVVPFGATPGSVTPEPIKQTVAMTTTSSVKAKFETKVEKSVAKPLLSSTKKAEVTVAKNDTSKKVTTICTTTAQKSITISKPDAGLSSDSDGKVSPPLERAMEKSLLDEISETLEQKKSESTKFMVDKEQHEGTNGNSSAQTQSSKIKFEITSLSETLESNKTFPDLKKQISRNAPITKDQTKPKISVFHKYSDSDSNSSDAENGVSAYYDVVESQISYENLPDGKCAPKDVSKTKNQHDITKVSHYSNSQYITDILLSSKTRAASYNLSEGNFMTSKITSDGLIVTKCSSDDALDSTGSSFDGSSDEETSSYNMIRSESDSGIGISIGSEYKNINLEKQRIIEKKKNMNLPHTNNSDYEDIQVTDQKPLMVSKSNYGLEKSRELHGEPDGSADPDGSLENNKEQSTTSVTTTEPTMQPPALPKSPPPTKSIDARPSFLHGMQKQPPILLRKPDVPVKPVTVSTATSPLKSFLTKRQPTNAEQQVISQLQMVMSKSIENLNAAESALKEAKDDAKLKKGRAPNPPPEHKSSAPPTPERDYHIVDEFEEELKKQQKNADEKANKATTTTTTATATLKPTTTSSNNKADDQSKLKNIEMKLDAVRTEMESNEGNTNETKASIDIKSSLTGTTNNNNNNNSNSNNINANSIYARKLPATPSGTVNSSLKNLISPVIREKDKRERATINPKFRSLNTFVMQRNNAAKNLELQTATSSLSLKQPMTPEPTPRNHHKALSMSEECLAAKLSSDPSNATSASTFNLAASSDKKSSVPGSPQKTKTKFSIKKFLRMGSSSKTSENLSKKDGIYSEICTGDDAGVTGKPRLVIIHPLDLNQNQPVEVVKDITKTNDAVTAHTVAVLTSKPPAPPLRMTEGQRALELNKPARPPPPKSAELRRKQKLGPTNSTASTSSITPTPSPSTTLTRAGGDRNNADCGNNNTTETDGSMKCRADNVYANLGEIRSAIAPRKPERTASMREREAQLELARKRHITNNNNNDNTTRNHDNYTNNDTNSICSSNEDIVSTTTIEQHHQHHQQQQQQQQQFEQTSAINKATHNNTNNNNNNNANIISTISTLTSAMNSYNNTTVDGKPPSGGSSLGNPSNSASRSSTVERKKATVDTAKMSVANKLEIFESRNAATTPTEGSRPSSLKDSVRKINSTIDSYLKDKRDYENMYDFVKAASSPPPPPTRSADISTGRLLLPPRRNNHLYSDTASVASYTRSEYGPARNYGLGNSLANIPRVISASYCGSEVGEFEIYAPYSYYGSEAGADVANDINDTVWGVPSATKNRTKATNRLRMRKGRSVVHKTIEDNYTAVVVANHEALAQVLDQLQQTPIIPPALRPLANAINLRFEDFTILDGAQAFVVGKKAFHAAVWTTAPVTLALSADCNQLSGVGGELNQLSGGVCGVLNPITEFCDLVPSYHLPLMPSTEVTLLQATISVLPRLQLDTLQTIGAILKGKSQILDKSNYNFRGSIPNLAGLSGAISGTGGISVINSALRNVVSVQNLSTLNEESGERSLDYQQPKTPNDEVAHSGQGGALTFDDVMTREVAFIMLQLINGMKNLQVKTVEEMPLSLSNVVLSKDVENKDAQARLCVLQANHSDEDEPMGTLCKCAHIALSEMLPSTKITPILSEILLQERSESLSKAKSVLEFVLWGPSDVVLSGSTKERELALQRWLDLERATVLHGLVRTRIELTVYDECHLMFLVRSTAKLMNDAAKIVYSYQQQHSNTSSTANTSGPGATAASSTD